MAPDYVPGGQAWFVVLVSVCSAVPKGNATGDRREASIARSIDSTLADPKIKARLAGRRTRGAVPRRHPGDAQMVAHVASETEKWGKAVRFSGATVD